MRKKLTLYLALTMASVVPATSQQKGVWTQYTTQNSEILGNTILATAADPSGSIWVGTHLGLCRLKGRTWTNYAMFNEKLKDQFVNCLTIDNDNDLWIGTDDYGVILFDGYHWTEYTDKTRELKMKFIREISIDKNNVKWIGVTLGGLVRFDGREWFKYTQVDSKLPSDFILCVAIDRKNKKWIGTNDGLCVFNDHVWAGYTTQNSELPHNIVPAIAIDKQGVKWIGTLGGLVRFDDKDWKVLDDRNTPLQSLQINDLAFDKDGMLWIVTDKGVALYDCHDNWTLFSHDNSPLPESGIQNIVIDDMGRKWIGTQFNGLFCYSGQCIKGCVKNEEGEAVTEAIIDYGVGKTKTDKNGFYHIEVPTGSSFGIRPQVEGYVSEPDEREVRNISAFLFNQNFVLTSGTEIAATPQGSRGEEERGKERVSVNPYLAEGYITITMESPVAEVEFVGSNGKSIRTIPQYKNGSKITITKMPKDSYTLNIRTQKGTKVLRFNLK
ncbi:MAG: two-component regulator propeller domain-containing protein [Bacteroidales bacterium]|nr:two-component regulator propeller domain-containing protein [Bacteroidales bacterium]